MIPAEIVIATSQGRRVFPVQAGSKNPLVKWRSEDPASSELDQVNRWFIRHGNCNWGMATGAGSGVFVVDTDTKVAFDWVQENGLTETYCVKTGGNTPEKLSYGYHFYFLHPGDGVSVKNSASELAPGVDVRGDGGYVLMPPSVTYMPYYVANERPIAVAPDWLIERVRRTEVERAASLATELCAQDKEHGTNIYRKACREYPKTPEGQWNNELNKLAGLAGRMVAAGCFDEEYALGLASEHIAAYGDKKAFLATWRSGYKWGLGSPWVPLGPEDVGFGAGYPIVPAGPAQISAGLKYASDVTMKPIRWLWPSWLPLGKLVIYAGPGGVGKSTVTFSWAATISRGGKWPDGMQCPAGEVLIWSGEDDPADTIVPRLSAMGADLKKIRIVQGGFDPARDFPQLKDQFKLGDIKLLIIDPIVSAVAGDMNKANEVRRGLQAIVDFAAELDCCVVGITHFNKGSAGKNPTERVTGSQAFTAFARMTLVSQKDSESGECLIARSKSNISVDSGGLKYRIEPMCLPQGIETTRVDWLEGVEGSAYELLTDIEPGDEKVSERKVDAAREYLKVALSQQDLPLKQLIEQGGFSRMTLIRAKESLPIRIQGDGKKRLWSMPFGPLIEVGTA